MILQRQKPEEVIGKGPAVDLEYETLYDKYVGTAIDGIYIPQ